MSDTWGLWGLTVHIAGAGVSDLTFTHSPGDYRYCPKVQAHKPGVPFPVGSIAWQPHDGEVEYLDVHPDHQRQGIGTALFNHAQGIDPRLHHSDTLSDDGSAFAQSMGHDVSNATKKMSGLNGPTPPMTMEPFDTRWSNGIMARHADDGRPLGHLHWAPDGEIDSVQVHPDFQRQGVASAMLDHARSDPATYESSYPIRHSTNFTSAGRGWAQADPEYHDPGDANVTHAEDDPTQWGWTAVKNHVPASVPYTGQNEAEMAPYLHTDAHINHGNGWSARSAAADTAWPKVWGHNHPPVPWNKQWSPNHSQHIPNPYDQ